MDDNSGGPENLSDVLGRLFAARGWGRISERLRLEQAWAEVIGDAWPNETRVATLRRGILEVEVRNSVLKQELTQFHKRRLLQLLRQKLSGQVLTDVKFRPGVW